MRRIIRIALLLIVFRPGWAETLLVIVHPEVAIDHMESQQLKDIYLLKRSAWSDGTPIIPINLSASSPLRYAFFNQVLEIDMQTAARVWLQMHFRGRQPPHVVSSPEAAVIFVSRIRGAIAYVPANVDTKKVKVIARFTIEDSQ